jgi:predicted DNA-binding transcriptional regulator AlpA
MRDDDELLDIKATCAFLGGNKPLNPSTVYRAIARGDLPPPEKPTGRGCSRWSKDALRAARHRASEPEAA